MNDARVPRDDLKAAALKDYPGLYDAGKGSMIVRMRAVLTDEELQLWRYPVDFALHVLPIIILA